MFFLLADHPGMALVPGASFNDLRRAADVGRTSVRVRLHPAYYSDIGSDPSGRTPQVVPPHHQPDRDSEGWDCVVGRARRELLL